MRQKKQDLLDYLVENYYSTETYAKQAVKMGVVSLNDKVVKRPGIQISPDEDIIKIIGDSKIFVSRGGYKLQSALKTFGISTKDKICLDVGASTGGFTDCLLQYGAEIVYSVDTGYGQLDWNLRKNPKVKLLERTNIRYLLPEKLYPTDIIEKRLQANLTVIDVSFISVLTILSNIRKLTRKADDSELIVLVKPQFEAGKNKVGRGGVIQNPQIHFEILYDFLKGCRKEGLTPLNLSYSPLLGASGNLEFLAHLTWSRRELFLDSIIRDWSQKVIDTAYRNFNLLK